MICFFNRRSVFTGYPFERVAGAEARLKEAGIPFKTVYYSGGGGRPAMIARGRTVNAHFEVFVHQKDFERAKEALPFLV